MSRRLTLRIVAAIITATTLALVWRGWHQLDGSLLLLGSRLC
ncbi:MULTISPECIES: hypothetical protein [unclassified Halomonas]|nr:MULTISPECIES: hypothetical protein [unclassified Halomonas]MDT0499547.1 hypothetical protein [Halomonas sp. PAR7]MDT0510636.1 hypothetical protein [Halomonas sp. LES1]MDT0592351.1 hypothetical protein [Halomonas sp. PAR8]